MLRGSAGGADFYEATSTFTFVATRKLAHPAIQGFVDGLQKATFPSPPAIQATWLWLFAMAGLAPASVCGPSLGTPTFRTRPYDVLYMFSVVQPDNVVLYFVHREAGKKFQQSF
jgi:hypothetical protein